MQYVRRLQILTLFTLLIFMGPTVLAAPEPSRKAKILMFCSELATSGLTRIRRVFWRTERDRLRALLHERNAYLDGRRQALLDAVESDLKREVLALEVFREAGARLHLFMLASGDAEVSLALKAIGAKQDLNFFGHFLEERLRLLRQTEWPPQSAEALRIARIEEALLDYGSFLGMDLFGD